VVKTAHHIDRHCSGISSPTQRYEIRVIGHLAPRWAAWFEGLTLTAHDDGTTVIDGPIVDQSALHGLLRKLGDLGLPIISVTPTTRSSS
jgi:hypothetical protein